MAEVTLEVMVLVDGGVFGTCALVLMSRPWMRLGHAASLYLAFHLLFITFRSWALLQGGRSTSFFGVPLDSVAYAVFCADVLLVSLTMGWLYVGASPDVKAPLPASLVRPRVLAAVCLITVPVGVWSLLVVGYVPGVDSATVVRGSYAEFTIVWPALCGVALIYRFGLRWFLVTPTAAYMVIMGLQGFGRFRLILPLALLLLVVLERRNARWPGAAMIALVIAVALSFPTLKGVGRDLQGGDLRIETLSETLSNSWSEASSGTSNEQAILDQAAIVIMRSEEASRLGLGLPYLKAGFFYVPRALWPEKPHLGEHLVELSTPAYPIGTVGAVSTIIGDFYYNFRFGGLIFGGFAFGVVTGRLHRWAEHSASGGAGRLLYLGVLATLIQVFRDGLLSFPIFMTLPLAPILFIAVVDRYSSPSDSSSGRGDF